LLKKAEILLALVFAFTTLNAQKTGSSGAGQIKGKFYGKVIDASTGKGMEFATVRLNKEVIDSATKSKTEVLVTGVISQVNGEFVIENVPLFGQYVVIVSAIGYQSKSINAFFPKPQQGKPMITEKDLGNIVIGQDTVMLQELVVEGKEPQYIMAIDKKIFTVSDNLMSEGATAEEALKTVPSVDVDMDGNVTLRNSSPQIFVDGKLSTLTLDQIPADAIQSIEVITNPSAKYDASGGMGGIINIVLKKDRRIGFNGSIRAGIDMRGKVNAGGNLNIREGKFNFFVGANLRQSKSIGFNETIRKNYFAYPNTNIFQENNSITNRVFMSGNAGVDYFINNRSTITFTQSFFGGDISFNDELNSLTDTLFSSKIGESSTIRKSDADRHFRSYSSSMLFKHLFPKEGRELSADVSYSVNDVKSGGDFETQLYNFEKIAIGNPSKQMQVGKSDNTFIASQTDFINPISEKIKIESGVRFSYRDFFSRNENYTLIDSTNTFTLQQSFTNNYKFIDQIYAAYTTFTHQLGKFGYQAGVRVESSDYRGTLIETGQQFNVSFPISIFPTAFVDYKLNDKDNLQLNYSRRVNRPGFFNLLPFIDYTDSLNLSRGNPSLKPEFTNSLEFSYLNAFGKSNSFLISVYFKNTTNLITRYQIAEFNDVLNRTVIMNTYANANNAYATGVDLTNKYTLFKWWDATLNFNLFQSIISAENIEMNLTNKMLSYFVKINTNFKIPKNFGIQLSGSYHSPRALQQSSSGMDRGGWGGNNASTAQGYTKEYYEVELAIKKDFLKNKQASATLSVSDILKTRATNTISESSYFYQETHRIRDQQFVRLNLSYRFGKFDSSIFRRKNTRTESGGMDM
jgi:outer membrane receptor protein involved in Fe transport